MNVKQLREELSKYPDDMDVMLEGGKSDFRYGMLNSVRESDVKFGEDEDEFDPEDESKPCAIVKCVILDEE